MQDDIKDQPQTEEKAPEPESPPEGPSVVTSSEPEAPQTAEEAKVEEQPVEAEIVEEKNVQVETEEAGAPVPGEIVEEAPAEQTEAEVPAIEGETEDSEMKPYTVRTEETGDKVYVVNKGRRYWVKNPETLTKLGFSLGQEKRVAFSELLAWPEGEPADLTIPGAVAPWDKPESAEEPTDEPDKPYKVWS